MLPRLGSPIADGERLWLRPRTLRRSWTWRALRSGPDITVRSRCIGCSKSAGPAAPARTCTARSATWRCSSRRSRAPSTCLAASRCPSTCKTDSLMQADVSSFQAPHPPADAAAVGLPSSDSRFLVVSCPACSAAFAFQYTFKPVKPRLAVADVHSACRLALSFAARP
eukprot:3170875-Rhodomonas_salina.2